MNFGKQCDTGKKEGCTRCIIEDGYESPVVLKLNCKRSILCTSRNQNVRDTLTRPSRLDTAVDTAAISVNQREAVIALFGPLDYSIATIAVPIGELFAVAFVFKRTVNLAVPSCFSFAPTTATISIENVAIITNFCFLYSSVAA